MTEVDQTETLEDYIKQIEDEAKALDSSSPLEEQNKALRTWLWDLSVCLEELRWQHLNDRQIMTVYWDITDGLKKLETIEAVRAEIAAGELCIAKMWHTYEKGISKHMEEWEKNNK